MLCYVQDITEAYDGSENKKKKNENANNTKTNEI